MGVPAPQGPWRLPGPAVAPGSSPREEAFTPHRKHVLTHRYTSGWGGREATYYKDIFLSFKEEKARAIQTSAASGWAASPWASAGRRAQVGPGRPFCTSGAGGNERVSGQDTESDGPAAASAGG